MNEWYLALKMTVDEYPMEKVAVRREAKRERERETEREREAKREKSRQITFEAERKQKTERKRGDKRPMCLLFSSSECSDVLSHVYDSP
jgi:hypothetical protein